MDLVNYDDGSTDDLDERYGPALDLWMLAHGCTVMDLTPLQLDRFVAWKIDCDVSLAVDLIRQRRLLARGVRS